MGFESQSWAVYRRSKRSERKYRVVPCMAASLHRLARQSLQIYIAAINAQLNLLTLIHVLCAQVNLPKYPN
jgi:hypothetical protein